MNNGNFAVVSGCPRQPLIAPAGLDLHALVAGLDRLLALLYYRPDTPIAEPDIAEIDRSVVHRNTLPARIADQLPGRSICELADDVEQWRVQVTVLGEEISKRRIAAGDAARVHRVQIERIGSNQRFHRRCVSSIGERVSPGSDALQSLVSLDADQCVFVRMTLRHFVIGVHRHELVKTSLQRGEPDASDPRRALGSGDDSPGHKAENEVTSLHAISLLNCPPPT